ncbi:MAG: NADH-quinone oxidoreductase, chain [Thermoleophilia bacterium]|nr:NADH-quinone oxidoreductase, chain [Thermoleophilia bacterium]
MNQFSGAFRGAKNTGVGLKTTLRSFLGRNITEQYPEVKHAVMPRFRGRHKLHLHANGLEKCVGCSLCAAACPADCIRVVAAENTPEHRVSAGERYAQVYEINMSRCIFCGYCEMACPFDAITLGNDWELADLNRDQMVYTKDMLLADPPTKDKHGMNLRAVTRPEADLDSALPVWLEETVAREREQRWSTDGGDS